MMIKIQMPNHNESNFESKRYLCTVHIFCNHVKNNNSITYEDDAGDRDRVLDKSKKSAFFQMIKNDTNVIA